MELNQPTRDSIDEGSNATIVKVNPSGMPNDSAAALGPSRTPG
jgi:hypothetical protein